MAKPIQAMRAAYEGNVESMADALTGRGIKQAANRTDNTGRGTLTCAVAGRSGDEQAAECVKMLLRAGAEVNLVDKHNQSALHFAARFGRPHCSIALIDAGADVNIATESGVRPIHLAILGSNPQVVSALIRAGADIESPSTCGKIPWNYAKETLANTKSDASGLKERRGELLSILELHLCTQAGHAPKKKISL